LAQEPRREDGVTIRLRRAHLWAVAGLLIGLAGGVLIGRATSDPRPVLYGIQSGGAQTAPSGADSAPESAAPVKVSTAGRPAFGPKDAKVTVVEFVDFQCPFCGRYARQTFPRLRREYGSRIRYVSRQFPLAIHDHARAAGVAAECANEQGAYWRYHHILFGHQNSLHRRALLEHAREARLDLTRFRACLGSRSAKARVARDERDGRGYGVTGTPAFFVNGHLLSGAQPYAKFKQAIDAELKKG